jgi:hypothetical protein
MSTEQEKAVAAQQDGEQGDARRMLAAERARSQRALAWLVTMFVVVLMIILGLALSSGIYFLSQAKSMDRALVAFEEQSSALVFSLSGMSNRVTRLEGVQHRLIDRMSADLADQKRATENLQVAMERVNRWMAASGSDKKDEGPLPQEMLDAVAAVRAELNLMKEGVDQTRAELMEAIGERVREQVEEAASAVVVRPPEEEVLVREATSREDVVRLFEEALGGAPSGTVSRPPAVEISVLDLPNGDRYEGEIQGGLFNGWGLYISAAGDRYEGFFRNDLRHGQGIFTGRDGARYRGTFRNDLRHGTGALSLADGIQYIGEFRDDLMSGRGLLTFPDGNRYLGEVRNGVPNGHGIMRFFNGDIYEGTFRDGTRTGFGTYTFVEGGHYVGGFVEGKRHGKGRFVYPGGEVYVGQFRSGLRHGIGTRVYPNGTRVKGLWEDDRLIRDIHD